MKILNISNLYPPHYVGGYELICQVVTEELRRRGHEMRVLTSNHGLGADAAPLDVQGVERSLRIHGYFGHPWLNIHDLKNLELHNNATVRRTVAEFNPDVVCVWNLGGISKSVLLTLEELGVPVSHYLSDHWIARSLKADVWMDWWNRKAMSAPARVLRSLWSVLGMRKSWSRIAPTGAAAATNFHRLSFCSTALKNITIGKGYDVAHAAVIRCPVNIARFTGEPVTAGHGMRRLLYVGRLAEDKGVMTALKAMNQLKGRFDGELRIYGKGDEDYTAQLHSFVRQHQLPVTFHSANAAEMPEVYRAHDALIFTSEWEEPFALTPLEAMASGLPVIGTTTGGSAELFHDGVNALTYAAGDAGMLARRIADLSQDAHMRAGIAAQGQRDVRERCAEPAIVDQIEAYLDETAKRWSEWSGEKRPTATMQRREAGCELQSLTA